MLTSCTKRLISKSFFMDRLAELIGKLKEQFEQKADHAEMLKTTRLIEQAIIARQLEEKNISTSRVSVVLPSGGFVADKEMKEVPAPEPAKTENTPAVHSPAVEKEIAAIEKMPEPVPVQNHPSWLYDPLHEVPTMASQEKVKDLNEIIGLRQPSLNDRLKAETRELAQALTESPVKDLKKAISLNDRFVFINELFRGDETMYERSLKTINDFHAYGEAEYWIERELKVKLGWDESSRAVQDFYRLVRRRFL